MTWYTVIAGFIFSGIGGYLVVSLLMDKLIWPYLKKKAGAEKDPAPLSAPLGITERLLYTGAFMAGQPAFVAVWLGLKIAVRWRPWGVPGAPPKTRGVYNAFLIGSGASIIFGYLGACIALMKFVGSF